MLLNETLKINSRLRRFSGRPDMTALVDVMFLLLIFFMLSSSFVQIFGFQVNPPRVGVLGSLGVEKFVITVSLADGKPEVFFNSALVNEDQLKEELAKVSSISGSRNVIIYADRKTPYEEIVKLMALAEKANLSVFLYTAPPEQKAETVFSTENE